MMSNAITQYYANTKIIPLITQIITHDYLIITHKFLFYSSLRTKIEGGPAPPSIFMRNGRVCIVLWHQIFRLRNDFFTHLR